MKEARRKPDPGRNSQTQRSRRRRPFSLFPLCSPSLVPVLCLFCLRSQFFALLFSSRRHPPNLALSCLFSSLLPSQQQFGRVTGLRNLCHFDSKALEMPIQAAGKPCPLLFCIHFGRLTGALLLCPLSSRLLHKFVILLVAHFGKSSNRLKCSIQFRQGPI